MKLLHFHFDNTPFTQKEARENFDKLVNQLQEYSSGVPIKSKVVKYGEYLQKCKDDAQKMTCVYVNLVCIKYLRTYKK